MTASEKQLNFFKNYIKGKLNTIKDDIGHIRYKLYIAMVDECNNYSELREMAELEMQIDMIAYTNGELAGKLKELNTDFESVINIDNTVEYKIPEETAEENNELFEDMEDDDVMDAMAHMLMQRIANEPEEEKLREELLDSINESGFNVDDINVDELDESDFGELDDILSEEEVEQDDDFDFDESDFGDLDDDNSLSDNDFEIDESDFGDLDDDEEDITGNANENKVEDKEFNHDDFKFNRNTEDDDEDFDINDSDFGDLDDDDEEDRDTNKSGFSSFDIDEVDFDELGELTDDDDGDFEEFDFDDEEFGDLDDDGESELEEFDDLDDLDDDAFAELLGEDDDYTENEDDLEDDLEDEFDDSGFDDLLGDDDDDEDEFDVDINDFGDLGDFDDTTDVSKAKSIRPTITDDSSDYINRRKINKNNVFDNGTDKGRKTQDAFNSILKIGGLTSGFGKKAAKTIDKSTKTAIKATEKGINKLDRSGLLSLPDEDDEFIDF